MADRKPRLDGLLQKSFRMCVNGVRKQFVVYGHSEEELIEKEQQKRIDIENKLQHPKSTKTLAESRLGAIGRNYNNRRMVIIAYRNPFDIDVRFDDGVIVTNVTYTDFTHGYVRHPDDPEDSFPTILGVGESRLNIQGLRMTITEWVNDKDITVRFDDGTELQHKRYSKFGSGGIQNPNARIITGANIEDVRGANSRLGKSRFNTQGLRMTIIKYRSSRDIDVQFEDGTIVEHKRYSLFEKGYIENPHYKTSFFGSMLIDNLAYIYNDTSNFYCHCTKCICKDIMTISEMRLHICSI